MIRDNLWFPEKTYGLFWKEIYDTCAMDSELTVDTLRRIFEGPQVSKAINDIDTSDEAILNERIAQPITPIIIPQSETESNWAESPRWTGCKEIIEFWNLLWNKYESDILKEYGGSLLIKKMLNDDFDGDIRALYHLGHKFMFCGGETNTTVKEMIPLEKVIERDDALSELYLSACKEVITGDNNSCVPSSLIEAYRPIVKLGCLNRMVKKANDPEHLYQKWATSFDFTLLTKAHNNNRISVGFEKEPDNDKKYRVMIRYHLPSFSSTMYWSTLLDSLLDMAFTDLIFQLSANQVYHSSHATLTCRECGKQFDTTGHRLGVKYCCNQCKDRAAKRRSRSK